MGAMDRINLFQNVIPPPSAFGTRYDFCWNVDFMHDLPPYLGIAHRWRDGSTRIGPSSWHRSVPLYDLKDGIFAKPQFAADQAIAPSRSDKCKHFWSEPIGFRPLPELAPETLTTRLCGGYAGA